VRNVTEFETDAIDAGLQRKVYKVVRVWDRCTRFSPGIMTSVYNHVDVLEYKLTKVTESSTGVHVYASLSDAMADATKYGSNIYSYTEVKKISYLAILEGYALGVIMPSTAPRFKSSVGKAGLVCTAFYATILYRLISYPVPPPKDVWEDVTDACMIHKESSIRATTNEPYTKVDFTYKGVTVAFLGLKGAYLTEAGKENGFSVLAVPSDRSHVGGGIRILRKC